MKRLKPFLAAVIVCYVLLACVDNSELSVQKDLLIEARWVHVVDFPEMDGPDSYFFNFLETGTVKIYPMSGGEVLQDTLRELRYIYDPDLGEMALEDYGILGVPKIDTEELVLENIRGKYTLFRYKDSDPLGE